MDIKLIQNMQPTTVKPALHSVYASASSGLCKAGVYLLHYRKWQAAR